MRVLLTGISGTGKTTVTAELAARGYRAVDADSDEYSEWALVADDEDDTKSPVEPGRDWVWREDRIEELLSAAHGGMLFLSGCAPNMGRFLPGFDHVVLLSAPGEVIAERLRTRTNNPYGKRPEEVARVLRQIDTVERLLRHAAGHEIVTTAPVEDVVAALLRIAESPKP